MENIGVVEGRRQEGLRCRNVHRKGTMVWRKSRSAVEGGVLSRWAGSEQHGLSTPLGDEHVFERWWNNSRGCQLSRGVRGVRVRYEAGVVL